VTRLSKRDVERLLDTYDDDPVQSLRAALHAIGADQSMIASIDSLSTGDRDALVRDLVEWRGLTPP
jgi:hypothetical protein